MRKNTLLIRNQSSVSSRVEKYFIKHHIDYDVIYSDNKDSPFIFSPFSSFPLKGSVGFKIFKNQNKIK
jgi:hypothetical protein